jgi:hypothetical protein
VSAPHAPLISGSVVRIQVNKHIERDADLLILRIFITVYLLFGFTSSLAYIVESFGRCTHLKAYLHLKACHLKAYLVESLRRGKYSILKLHIDFCRHFYIRKFVFHKQRPHVRYTSKLKGLFPKC